MCQGSAAAFGVPSWEQPPPPSATDGSVPSVTSLRLPGCTWGATATHLAPHPGLGAVPPCVSAIAFCLSFQPWLPVRLSPPCPRCLGGASGGCWGGRLCPTQHRPHRAQVSPGWGAGVREIWVTPRLSPSPPQAPTLGAGDLLSHLPVSGLRGSHPAPGPCPCCPLYTVGDLGQPQTPPKCLRPSTLARWVPVGLPRGCVCVGGGGGSGLCPAVGLSPRSPPPAPKGPGERDLDCAPWGRNWDPLLVTGGGGLGGHPAPGAALGGGVGGC